MDSNKHSHTDPERTARDSHIIQTLQTTLPEQSIGGNDVDKWVNRLTSLDTEVSTDRDAVDPGLLTQNEAEVVVRWYVLDQSASEIAEILGVGTQRVYDLRYAAEDDLLAADATLSIFHEIEQAVAESDMDDGSASADSEQPISGDDDTFTDDTPPTDSRASFFAGDSTDQDTAADDEGWASGGDTPDSDTSDEGNIGFLADDSDTDEE
jgi:predicted DNA-binding protein YlxM (UPF0122 family)